MHTEQWKIARIPYTISLVQEGYLSGTCAIPYVMKTWRKACDTLRCDTISKGSCAIRGVSCTEPLSRQRNDFDSHGMRASFQRAPNPQPNVHSPASLGQTAVIPSERVQIWVCLFLHGWSYPGVRLQIRCKESPCHKRGKAKGTAKNVAENVEDVTKNVSKRAPKPKKSREQRQRIF